MLDLGYDEHGNRLRRKTVEAALEREVVEKLSKLRQQIDSGVSLQMPG